MTRRQSCAIVSDQQVNTLLFAIECLAREFERPLDKEAGCLVRTCVSIDRMAATIFNASTTNDEGLRAAALHLEVAAVYARSICREEADLPRTREKADLPRTRRQITTALRAASRLIREIAV